MVVRGKQDVAFELYQIVVESLDGFQVQVVGWRIENQTVGVLQLHTRNHTTHLLATAEYTNLLLDVFVLEQHTTQERLHHHFVACAKLTEPVNEVHLRLEELGIVQWQVGCRDGDAPLIGACISLAIAVDNLEQRRHGFGVVTQEYGLLTFLDSEVHIVEQYGSVSIDSLQAFYLQNLCARLALHREDDARILTCRRCDFLDVQLLQHLLTRCGLLRLCHIGRETADELLQLLALLVGLHLLVLSLTQSQL